MPVYLLRTHNLRAISSASSIPVYQLFYSRPADNIQTLTAIINSLRVHK